MAKHKAAVQNASNRIKVKNMVNYPVHVAELLQAAGQNVWTFQYFGTTLK